MLKLFSERVLVEVLDFDGFVLFVKLIFNLKLVELFFVDGVGVGRSD